MLQVNPTTTIPVLIIYGLRLSMKMGKYTLLKTFTDMTPNWSKHWRGKNTSYQW